MLRYVVSFLLAMTLTHCNSNEPSNQAGEVGAAQGTGEARQGQPKTAAPKGPTRCQAWVPKRVSSVPPASLVACEKDADCGYGEVRACCGSFVVAINSRQRKCLVEATGAANCRAVCRTPPPGFQPINKREGFSTVCVQGVCKLSWLGNLYALEKSPHP